MILPNIRFLVLGCIFSAATVAAQSPLDDQGTRLKALITRYADGDTSALRGIEDLLTTSRFKRRSGQALSDTLLNISNYLGKENQYQTALVLDRLGLWHASKLHDETRAADHKVGLALHFYQLDEIDSTQFYLKLLKQVPASAWSDYAKISYSNVLALLAEKKGGYLEAIEHYWNILDTENLNNRHKADIQINLADLFNNLGHYHRSLDYSNQALDIFLQLKDTSQLCLVNTNLGVSWMHLDSLERAAFHHLEAIKYASQQAFGRARGLANYANVLRRQGKLQDALAAIDSSISICLGLDLPFGVALNKVNRAHVLLDLKQPAEAIRLLQEAERNPVAQSALAKIEICSLYAKAFEQSNNLPLSYTYLRQYVALKDSVDALRTDRLVVEWEERIIKSRRDRELLELNSALERTKSEQRQTTALFLLFSLFAFAVGRLLVLRQQKARLRAKLTEEEHENTRLQLAIKEKELSSQSVHLRSVGSLTEEVSGKLKHFKKQLDNEQAKALTKIIRDFQSGLPDEIWADFHNRFEHANERFNQKLLEINPELNPVEIKIANFLRLNLSSKEISRLSNRSVGTIANVRSALRKKLHLSEDDNLTAFLMSL